MNITESIENNFKDGHIKYFQQSDKHKNIEGDTYLRYETKQHYGNPFVYLWFGGDNGEVCLLITNDGDKLNDLIKLITY